MTICIILTISLYKGFGPSYWGKPNAVKPVLVQTDWIGVVEVGPIPMKILWDGRTYYVHGQSITKVGKKIGTSAESQFDKRDIYEIEGFDPKKEIAISTIQKDIYFKAVANEDNNKPEIKLIDPYTYSQSP